MKGIVGKTKQAAIDQARKSAKQMAQEPYEMAKNIIPPQILEGGKKDSRSLITEVIKKDIPKPEQDLDEEEIEVETNIKLEELEQEIRRIREERKAKEEEWKKAQEEAMKNEKPPEQPFVEVSSGKKRGFLGFGKKKQGTKEMGKQTSG